MDDLSFATDAALAASHQLAHDWHSEIMRGSEVFVLKSAVGLPDVRQMHDDLAAEMARRGLAEAPVAKAADGSWGNFDIWDPRDPNAGDVAIPYSVPIVKATDDSERVVYGPVLIPGPYVDLQHDVVKSAEIRKAAHGFLEKFQGRAIGDMHVIDNHRLAVVESYVAPVAFELTPDGDTRVTKTETYHVAKGTWVMAVHVNDPAEWALVKQGARTGFSIEGRARRVTRKREELEKIDWAAA